MYMYFIVFVYAHVRVNLSAAALFTNGTNVYWHSKTEDAKDKEICWKQNIIKEV